MDRRGFLAALGLGVVAAPALPRRVYSFLWGAPVEPLPPFFGVNRNVLVPALAGSSFQDALKRIYSADYLDKIWERGRRDHVHLVSPKQYEGFKRWAKENPA